MDTRVKPAYDGTDVATLICGPVQPVFKKFFAFSIGRNSNRAVPSRTAKRGTSRSSRNVERDAMDADGAARRAVLSRTAKSCGSGAPTLAPSSWTNSRATGARKPGPREEHEGNRKTIARGMSECFGLPVVTTLVCFHSSHARLERSDEAIQAFSTATFWIASLSLAMTAVKAIGCLTC